MFFPKSGLPAFPTPAAVNKMTSLIELNAQDGDIVSLTPQGLIELVAYLWENVESDSTGILIDSLLPIVLVGAFQPSGNRVRLHLFENAGTSANPDIRLVIGIHWWTLADPSFFAAKIDDLLEAVTPDQNRPLHGE